MSKRLASYTISWAVLFALFNVIAFVSPGWIWFEKYDDAFWIGYTLITVMFIGQLACAWFALTEKNAQKLFYEVSLISTSYTGLIVTFVVGGLCMLISPLPYWVGVLVCTIALATNIVAVVKASTAIDIVSAVDEKSHEQTNFIKNLTADAQALLTQAKTAEEKAACKKVYEALRYSDPMSSDALSEIEWKLKEQFMKFSNETTCDVADELLLLIGERNSRCKAHK